LSVSLDTSFLVSLYTPDVHSARANQALQAATAPLLITTFAEFEFVNALGLLEFRREISSVEARSAIAKFELNLRASVLKLTPLPENVFVRARQLSRETTPRLGTRAADLLHVAAALELGCGEFYSFDRQQRALANEVKLKVNPFT